MIELQHVELTAGPRLLSDENTLTYARYWQAQIPDTGLFAVTEESFAVKAFQTAQECAEYVHVTQFFICRQGVTSEGPARDYVDRMEDFRFDRGSVLAACQGLREPTSWSDNVRQVMLINAIDLVAQDA